MSWWPPRLPWSKSALASPSLPNRTSPLEEARQQFLNKEAKLRTAYDAVIVANMDDLAAEEMEGVRALKAKYMKNKDGTPAANGEGDVGDRRVIVCDDYRHNDPPQSSPSKLWPIVAAVGLTVGAGLGGYVAHEALKKPDPPPVVVPPAVTPQEKPGLPPGFNLELIPPKKEQ